MSVQVTTDYLKRLSRLSHRTQLVIKPLSQWPSQYQRNSVPFLMTPFPSSNKPGQTLAYAEPSMNQPNTRQNPYGNINLPSCLFPYRHLMPASLKPNQTGHTAWYMLPPK